MDVALTALMAAAMLAASLDARPGLRTAIGVVGLLFALYLFCSRPL